MIELKGVHYSYGDSAAVSGISLTVRRGELVAIMGANASGKSTMARMMNGLIIPDRGECLVEGVSTAEDPYHARRLVGMVFQDPDDQIVASTVEDDIAFGLKNIGLSGKILSERAREAMELLKIHDLGGKKVHSLSGGKKQLVAIAGIVAMKPSYIVMDEPASMLDGEGAALVRDAISMIKGRGCGIALITHDPSEAVAADRLIILQDGRVVLEGPPGDVFNRVERLADAGVDVPDTLKVSIELERMGLTLPRSLTPDGMVKRICPLL